MDRVKRSLLTLAGLAALALGGSAIANAASNATGTPSASSTPAAPAQGYGAPQGGRAPTGPHGRHVGANGREEQPLSGEVAAKVTAAAKAKVPGATAERVETDVDHGSPTRRTCASPTAPSSRSS